MPAQRTVGQDHDYYEWSPIVSRRAVRWPGGAPVALCVILNLDHFDWYLPPETPGPVTRMGFLTPPAVALYPDEAPDITSFGQREYGLRCGVFRVLSVLDRYDITPTIAMDKTVAENYPFLVAQCQDRGLEFIARGLSDRQLLHSGMSAGEEREYIRDSVAALTNATGRAPRGWLSPHFQETLNTPELLAAEGIHYVCDWCNDEQPYRMKVSQGELYSVGVTLDLDDVWCHLANGRRIDEYGQMIVDAFHGLYADGEQSGRMMVLNLHPWVIGQPWRIKYLDKALANIDAHAGVWKASVGEIIGAYRAQSDAV